MKFIIELDNEDLREALANGALALLAGKATADKPQESKAPAKKPAKADTVEDTTEAAPEAPVTPKIAPQNDESVLTIETVRATLAALTKAGKRAEVKALLQEFGTDKLPEVKPEDYPALMAKAAQL